MNVFQKQLVMNDGRTLAEHGRQPHDVAPQRVSIAEFEADMRAARKTAAADVVTGGGEGGDA